MGCFTCRSLFVEVPGKGVELVFDGDPIERDEVGGDAVLFGAAQSPESSCLEKLFDFFVGNAFWGIRRRKYA